MELINLYARILFSGKACELFHRVSSASLICCELPLMCHGRYRHLEGLTGSSAGVRLYGVCVRNGEPVTFLAPRPPLHICRCSRPAHLLSPSIHLRLRANRGAAS